MGDSRDPMLIGRAQQGNPLAFEEVVREFQDKVYRLALRLSGNLQDAEEILQKTFLQVYQKLPTFRGDAQFSTWLYRVAVNTALMHQREEKRRKTESLERYLPRYNEEGRLARLDLDYGRAARADELLEEKEFTEKTLEALARLPEIYRTVFVMRDLEEISTEETAQILDLEPATVRKRLHRARLILRGYLGHLVGGEP